jgi:glycosyltransferase involved in cell wall biosynthesis
VILTRDEERNLPRALTSLPRGMPVFVLDAFSRDRTLEYAMASGANVYSREWTDFVDARRFALSQVRTPWVFMLDADEALDDVLLRAVVATSGEANGYIVRRTTYFGGKPMRMWSHEPLLRLARVDAARIEALPAAGGSAALHERLVCDGPTEELRGTLLHYSYPELGSYRARFALYTSVEATGLHPNIGRALASVARVPVQFVWNLVRRGALLDGPRGWYVAWMSAWYPAVVQVKALAGRPSTSSG